MCVCVWKKKMHVKGFHHWWCYWIFAWTWRYEKLIPRINVLVGNVCLEILFCALLLATHNHTNKSCRIENDKVENHSITQSFNKQENWTKALKYTLCNLKWALYWFIGNTNFQPLTAMVSPRVEVAAVNSFYTKRGNDSKAESRRPWNMLQNRKSCNIIYQRVNRNRYSALQIPFSFLVLYMIPVSNIRDGK